MHEEHSTKFWPFHFFLNYLSSCTFLRAHLLHLFLEASLVPSCPWKSFNQKVMEEETKLCISIAL